MSKWTKRLLIGGVSIALLVLVGLVALYFCLGSIIKTGVETLGPKITKCAVTVADIKIAPLAGRVEISGMVVGNPEGFKTESAFRLNQIRVILDPKSVLTNRIHIHEILIDAPEITYEVGLSGSNIGAIQKNVEEFTGTSTEEAPVEEPPKAEEPVDEAPGKKVQLDDFRLVDAKVNLSAKLLEGKAMAVPLPEIRLQDIGKEEEGQSVAEIVSEIFTAVFKGIGDAVTGSGAVLADGKKLAAETLEEAGSAAKDVGEEAKKAGSAAKESAGKALDNVKGLFKRK